MRFYFWAKNCCIPVKQFRIQIYVLDSNESSRLDLHVDVGFGKNGLNSCSFKIFNISFDTYVRITTDPENCTTNMVTCGRFHFRDRLP